MPLSSAFFVVALLSQAEAAPAAPPANLVDPKDEVTCRRDAATGSRLKAKKVCRTRREWDLRAEAAKLEKDRMTQLLDRRGN